MSLEQNLGTDAAPEGASSDQVAASPETVVEQTVDTEKAPTDVELGAEGSETDKEVKEKKEEKSADQKVVPLAALHEERERRKELTKRLEDAETKRIADLAKVEERVNIILGSLQQQQQKPAVQEPQLDLPPFIRQYIAANPGASEQEVVDAFFREEPTNYLKWQNENIAKQQAELTKRTQQQDETAKVQTQFNNFIQAYKAQTQEFTTKTPDFVPAYNFLLKQRDDELQLMGFVDPIQRNQILQNEEMGIVEQAFRNRKNPAEAIYQIAKFRGYTVAPDNTNTAGVKPENLDAEKKAALAAKSIGAVPGSPSGKINAEALINMSEEEFAEATKDNKWEKFFKGEA